jgi:hypothetical protein
MRNMILFTADMANNSPWHWIIMMLLICVLIMMTVNGLAKWLSPWNPDPYGNPYRRYCKECGTGQSFWTWGYNGSEWSTFLPVNPCSRKH